MTDAPNDETTPDEPTGPTPDGWAAWGKKDSDPLKPKTGVKHDSPETDESSDN